MHEPGRARGWVLLSLVAAAACEQQLSIPRNGQAPVDAIAGASDEGFTGTAGASDAADFAERLPTVDSPVHTRFGSGGEGESPTTSPDPREVARGGSSGAAPSGPSSGAPASDGGAGSGGAAPEQREPPRLLFSEYVEGLSKYKALEIYAIASSSLEGCELLTYANGKSDSPARVALHGLLAAGETQVLCSPTLIMLEPSACDVSENLTFNGDDALELACGEAVLDVFGQIGGDPGAAWGDGATVDHTLRRRCSVTTGGIDGKQPFDPAIEWLTLPADTFTGLGEHRCTEPDSVESP